ncbi:MAG: hypothetical protein WCR54_07355 [Clostridia bacterium]
MGKVCDICGKPSGMFPLCKNCLTLKNEGKIIKDEKLGKWVLKKPTESINKEKEITNKEKETTKKVLGNGKCIICGKDAPNGYLCYECYKKKEAEKIEFVGKRNKQEAMDHYFNQRNCLFKIKNPDYMENGVIRMFAIAEEVAQYNDNYLKNRVVEDITALMLRKNDKINTIVKEKKKVEDIINETKQSKNFDDIDYRKQWAAEHQCDDGHYVRSYSEMLIDNWLYNNGYVHAYEKSVFMKLQPDAVVLSDFYLPDGNVYVEFWGLNDDMRYLKRKEEIIQMYEENQLNLISLEEPDVKRLNDILPRRLFEYIKNK